MGRGKSLSNEELEYIKVNLLVKSPKEIANELGRNYYTIYRISQQLGIERSHNFTAQEDNYIKKNYKKDGAKRIASKIGITTDMVYNRVRKLGFAKKRS